MPHSSIWVLIAGESKAAICSSREGSSQLLRTVAQADSHNQGTEIGRRNFALQLMSELFRGARSGAYDGIIIIAAKSMLDELREIALPEFRRRVVAEIPRNPSDIPFFGSGPTPAWETVQ